MTGPAFSIVTTCKGRQRALPTFVAQAAAEVIVVDYDCPDRTKDWIAAHCPEVRVAAVTESPIFNLSRARNIGAELARAPWLVLCDADNMLAASFTREVQRLVVPGTYLRISRDTPQGVRKLNIPLVCEAPTYREIGGYDDALSGWGAEDWEFVQRLEHRGVREVLGPATLFESLPHSNDLRSRFHEHDIYVSMVINHFYAKIKERHFQTRGRWLTAGQRHATHDQVRQAVLASLADPQGHALIDVSIEGAVPPWTARLNMTEIRRYHEMALTQLVSLT